jgi:molybdopterin-containing oxidoreductase family membrane subunit
MEVTRMARQKSLTWSFYGWMAVLTVGILIGIWGAVTLLVEGHAVTGTNTQVPWGIFVPGYVFFVAASAGCVIVSLGYALGVTKLEHIMKRAVFLAIVTLVAGGILILLDLGSPQNVFYFIFSPNLQSPMWWMSVFYILLYLTLLLIEFYFIHTHNVRNLRVLSIIVALSAIAVHSTLGAIFGFASVRTYFGGAFAPVYFILIAVVIGTALLLFVTILQYKFTRTAMSQELHSLVLDLGKFLGVAVGVTIFFTIWRDLAGIRSTIATTSLAYEHILSTWWYWVIVILMGLIIPLFLLYNPKTRNLNGIAVSSILVLVGMFAARTEFTLGGQIVPVLQDLKHLEYPLGSYSSTFVEIAVVILAFAVCAVLYTWGTKKLALEEIPHHD